MRARKRSFHTTFAEPPAPFKWGGPYVGKNDETDSSTEDTDSDSTSEAETNSSTEDTDSDSISEAESDSSCATHDPKEPTIGGLIAAGSDKDEILALISSLTNDIHPVFRDKNICSCKYAEDEHCTQPYYAAHPEELTEEDRASEIASPFAKDNILVHAVLQLATLFITHEDTLPFWAGIVDRSLEGPPGRGTFHVPPRKKLSPARKAETLQHLENFTDDVRLHFKVFEGNNENLNGYTVWLCPEEGDPDYDPDMDPDSWCECDIAYCGCPTGAVYAYRDGAPVVEDDTMFQHIFMNVDFCPGFDQSSDQWRSMTINDVKKVVFQQAVTLCHEFSHAFMFRHNKCDMWMNEEPFAETGYAWENFVFGGTIWDSRSITEVDIILRTWPDLHRYYKDSATGDNPMPIRHFLKCAEGRYLPVATPQWTRFLNQSFWDETNPSKDYNKMWLRPYFEVPIHMYEYCQFTSGHVPPVMGPAKRRRFSDAAMERHRHYRRRIRWDLEQMHRRDRCYRYNEKLREREDEFHDREKQRLDAFWAGCVKDVGTDVFLK